MNFVEQKISGRKISTIIVTVIVAAVFACAFQPSYHDNSNAIMLVATSFSVLAGFLITVLAITADERSLCGANWRQDVVYFELIKRDLRRHRNMFYLYLTVLLLAFVGALDVRWLPSYQVALERLLLFLAAFALLWSFRIPGYLMRRHMDLLDARIIERRMKETH